MRSSTSTIGPTSISRPVSSRTSRAIATSSVSPTSTAPPGRLHSPLSGSLPRHTSSTRPPSTTTAPTPTIGRSGYCRSSPIHRHLALSSQTHNLHDHPLLPLAVELGIKHLLPRSEIELAAGDWQHHLMSH